MRLVAHLKALLKSSSTVSSSHESCQRWSPVVVEAAPMVRPTPAPGALDAPAVRCERSVSASFQSSSSEGDDKVSGGSFALGCGDGSMRTLFVKLFKLVVLVESTKRRECGLGVVGGLCRLRLWLLCRGCGRHDCEGDADGVEERWSGRRCCLASGVSWRLRVPITRFTIVGSTKPNNWHHLCSVKRFQGGPISKILKFARPNGWRKWD